MQELWAARVPTVRLSDRFGWVETEDGATVFQTLAAAVAILHRFVPLDGRQATRPGGSSKGLALRAIARNCAKQGLRLHWAAEAAP